MRLFRALALPALLLVPALAHAEDPAPCNLGASALADAAAGDPYVSVTRGDPNRAELCGIINGTPSQVWAVIMDYGSYEDWFPDQQEASVVSTSGNSSVLEGEVHMPFPWANRRFRINETHRETTVDGQTHYIDTWTHVEGSGNIDDTTGFWYVMPYGSDQTMVRLVTFVDLGVWLPDFIINWGTRRMLPGIVEGIQDEVDARY